jgi:catechol 2,3-dioxygenase-like lactoylglutathione lyase family enzyme
MKFASVRIITDDVAGLTRFYLDITGIVPTTYSDDYIEFKMPACALAIASRRSMMRYGAGAAEPAANRTSILEFLVDDVDREYARLRNIIRTFELEPTTQPWGNRSMLFRDPDGNLINFFAPATDRAHARYAAAMPA